MDVGVFGWGMGVCGMGRNAIRKHAAAIWIYCEGKKDMNKCIFISLNFLLVFPRYDGMIACSYARKRIKERLLDG